MRADIRQAWAEFTAHLRTLEPTDTADMLEHARGLDEIADAYMRLYNRVAVAVAPPRYIDPEKRSKLTMASMLMISDLGMPLVKCMRAEAALLRCLAEVSQPG
jgi:hypothetical protein